MTIPAADVDFLQTGGALARSVEARLRELPSPKDFGVAGGADDAGYAAAPDDTAAWQKYFDYCVANHLPIAVQTEIISKITDTLTISPDGFIRLPDVGVAVWPAIDLGNVTFVYGGTRDRVVLDIGSSATPIQHSSIVLPSVTAKGAVAWPMTAAQMLGTQAASHVDTAIRLVRVNFSAIEQRLVYGFSKGIEFNGCAWNRVMGAHIFDCRLGRVWTTEGDNPDLSHSNENVIVGGRFASTSNSNSFGDAYGDVLTWDKKVSDRGHNNNRFYAICYELGVPAEPGTRIPVLLDGVGFRNFWHRARQEHNKGPFAICNGGPDQGIVKGTVQALYNTFDLGFNSSVPEQLEYVLQVNGAYGNLYTGYGAGEHHWQSGDLRHLLTSHGAANAPYIGGELFFLTPAGAPVRTISSGRVATARDSIHLLSFGIFTAIDTSLIKTFRVALAAKFGFAGQVYICAFDAAGVRLTGNATDPIWGDEPYVKGVQLSAKAGYGGGYSVGDRNFTSDYTFTVREEVAKVYVGYDGGGNVLAAQALALTGYSTPKTQSVSRSFAGMRVFADVDDPGTQPLARSKPNAGGAHGFYARGQRVGSVAAATTQPGGWVCTGSGWLAAAWTANTAYAPPGRIVINNLKMYELVIAGTSAGAVGPTGTGDNIADNSCRWKHIGGKATFEREARLGLL